MAREVEPGAAGPTQVPVRRDWFGVPRSLDLHFWMGLVLCRTCCGTGCSGSGRSLVTCEPDGGFVQLAIQVPMLRLVLLRWEMPHWCSRTDVKTNVDIFGYCAPASCVCCMSVSSCLVRVRRGLRFAVPFALAAVLRAPWTCAYKERAQQHTPYNRCWLNAACTAVAATMVPFRNVLL